MKVVGCGLVVTFSTKQARRRAEEIGSLLKHGPCCSR